VIRIANHQIGRGQPVLPRYERITFEKALVSVHGKPVAAFICPGHPLLRRHHRPDTRTASRPAQAWRHPGDPGDSGTELRVLFYLEHAIQDARTDGDGQRRVISRRLQFVEIDEQGNGHAAGYAPYLDYRPLIDEEREQLAAALDKPWLQTDLERQAMGYAVQYPGTAAFRGGAYAA